MTASERFLLEYPAARLFGFAHGIPDEALAILLDYVIPRAATIRDPFGAARVLFRIRSMPWVREQTPAIRNALCRTAGHALRLAGGKVTMLRGNDTPVVRTIHSDAGDDHARVTATVPNMAGLVGLVWVVAEGGTLAVVARPVLVRKGNLAGLRVGQKATARQFWKALREKGAQGLHDQGIPLAPLVADHREWPRGQVLFDCARRRFVLRSDKALHHPIPRALISAAFKVAPADLLVEDDGVCRAAKVLF